MLEFIVHLTDTIEEIGPFWIYGRKKQNKTFEQFQIFDNNSYFN